MFSSHMDDFSKKEDIYDAVELYLWLACVPSWHEQGQHYIYPYCFETTIITVNRWLKHLYLYLKQVLHLYCDMFDIRAFEYAGSLEGKILYPYHVYSPTTVL